MAGKQNGLAAVVGEGLQQAHRLDAAGDIEEGRGLIEDDDGRLLGQRTGYHGLLPLAVAQRGHVLIGLADDTGIDH